MRHNDWDDDFIRMMLTIREQEREQGVYRRWEDYLPETMRENARKEQRKAQKILDKLTKKKAKKK